MTAEVEILRYAAFTVNGAGGNPAGVVLDATGMSPADMQRIAAEVGFSETAFLVPVGEGRYDVRFFAPEQEVPFCGHATVASAVALAERGGPAAVEFLTPAGRVPVRILRDLDGPAAELTSVPPVVEPADPDLVDAVLAALHWSIDELDPRYPVSVASAGARHLILVVRSRRRLADLAYDFASMAPLMREHALVTLQLVWPEAPLLFHARNPFPPGGVVEDPATGAAAAAFGGYLRHHGLIDEAATFTIHQGEDMGRPSRLTVELVAGEPGVRVRGHAAALD
ncbi:MAG TPA: PhzF family phenazine biosynthesis isomerase [Microlunatus sp.]|nr:PhzF family phenazine biosynthesis isomerase [Microlunatus sp.]